MPDRPAHNLPVAFQGSESVSGGASSSWTYDWVGNRDPGTYDYNLVDELEPGVDYQYDMKGALEYIPTSTGDPRRHFTYGSDELMSSIAKQGTNPADETSFVWDADEHRLRVQEDQTYAVWDSLYDTTAGIPAVMVERKTDSHAVVTVTYYMREPGGELLASYGGTNTRYYHFDALGSTVDATDGAGSSVGSHAYGAWGSVAGTTGTTVYPYLYVGQLGYYTHTADQGTEVQNWLNLGVRFYDPSIGRFERRDPVDGAYSSYSYSENAPLQLVDAGGRLAGRYRGPCPECLKRGLINGLKCRACKAMVNRACSIGREPCCAADLDYCNSKCAKCKGAPAQETCYAACGTKYEACLINGGAFE